MNPEVGSFVRIARASPRYNIVQITDLAYDGVRIKALRHDGKAVFTLPRNIVREATVAEISTFYARRYEHHMAIAAQTNAVLQACQEELTKLTAYQSSVGRD